MAFSDIIKKLADESTSLTVEEKDELYIEARRMEQGVSLLNGMVVPGTSSLKVDGLTANRAQIIDAEIQSATAGGGDVSIDGDGIWIKNQQAAFGFEDLSGERFDIIVFSDGYDDLVLANKTAGPSTVQGDGHIRLAVDTKTGNPIYFYFQENPGIAETATFRFHNTAGVHSQKCCLNMGDNTVIWAGVDGQTTSFNMGNYDTDFRIGTVSFDDAFRVDAGADAVSFFGPPNNPSTLLTLDGGVEKRFEFGGDHYIPIRTSTDPNVYFNEANQDMDFHVEGTTDGNLLFVDAGTNTVGICVAGESNIKLNVYGDERLNGKLKLGALNGDIWAYCNGSKFILRYNDSGTVRYKYLDMAGTGVTWVHTTTAP